VKLINTFSKLNNMKQIIKLIMAMLVFANVAGISFAQIPGKIYQPGDTIIMDGMSCVIYKVDETGMHGTAMSPFARTEKQLDKLKKQTIKHFKKEIKKGKATQEDMNVYLACVNNIKQIPIIVKEKAKKGGAIFRIDDWSSKIPQGWRIPSTKDAEDFATFYCGGLGKDYAIKVKFLLKYKDLTTDIFASHLISSVAFYGIIVSDSYNPSDVKFLQKWHQNATFKDWFQLNDKFVGKELTVAVKDF